MKRLFNQLDLIALRTKQGVHTLVPGLTGWAQVNGRDELPIPEKVKQVARSAGP
jgi:O-antigen biosynthesis protein WbqP